MERGKDSDVDFLYIFDLCFYFGFIGVHRIRLKKIFSGVLYLLNFATIVVIILLGVFLKVNVNNISIIVFILVTAQYCMWARDLILIVSGKFKDKNNKIISNVVRNYNSSEYFSAKEFFKKGYESYLKCFKKKAVLKDKNLNSSDKDIFILYFLTGKIRLSRKLYFGEARRGNVLGFLGLYKFYSGRYLSGFLNIILSLINILLLFNICFSSRRLMFWFEIKVFFMMFSSFFIFLTVLYDKYKILSGKYKDCYGKYIWVNEFKD